MAAGLLKQEPTTGFRQPHLNPTQSYVMFHISSAIVRHARNWISRDQHNPLKDFAKSDSFVPYPHRKSDIGAIKPMSRRIWWQRISPSGQERGVTNMTICQAP